MTLVWQDGCWIAAEEIRISPGERGLSHGFGLFETMLAVDGNFPLWERHKARLENSMKRLGWNREIPDIHGAWENMPGKRRVRLTVTAGSGAPGSPPGNDGLFLLSSTPFPADAAPPRVGICPWKRNEHSPLAGLKTTSYAENLIALRHARENGFDEYFWANTAGDLCETCTANVFLVKRGVLVTPSLAGGCLPGIARAVVLETAAKLGIPVEERRVGMEERDGAEEIFLTNAVRGPFAVAERDGKYRETFGEIWKQQ